MKFSTDRLFKKVCHPSRHGGRDPVIKNFAQVLLNALYPPKCPLCDELVRVRHEPCERCVSGLLHLEADANFPALEKVWFEKCRSCFAYDGRVRDALHSFKYGRRQDLVRFFVKEMSVEAEKMGEFDVAVPVPLHSKKIGARGFNQSAMIAKLFARMRKKPVDLDSLRRIRDIPPQVGLHQTDRIENVKGAFEVPAKRAARITGKKILLIDDVATTGATVNECARALKNAGAEKVMIITVARVV